MARAKTNASGGAAAQAGLNYQNRVAAWMAVSILAEQEATPPWGLDPDTTLDFLRCETEQPLDDLLIGTSRDGHAFVQVKTTIKPSTKADSPLAALANQIVRQFLSYSEDIPGEQRWERPLALESDRFVLVTRSASPDSTTKHLPTILTRLRNARTSVRIADIAFNGGERGILTTFTGQLRRAWLEIVGTEPSQGQMLQVLRFLWVQVLDVDEDGRDERDAKNLLRASVLENPVDADSAWSTLVLACADYASRRSGADRVALQKLLTSKGIKLKAPRSYRADIARLQANSASILQSLRAQRVSEIPIGDRLVKIERPSSFALRNAAEQHSIVVVGEPGAGKSGALHDIAHDLISENRDVVFLTVDRIEAGSLGQLRQELGLDHEITDVLCNWPADRRPILIVDALDAARSAGSAQTLYELLATTMRECGQWRIVASIWQFDLRYNANLQELFAGRPPTEFRSAEFSQLCHLSVPLLDHDIEEWKQIALQAPELGRLFVDGTESLRRLLYVPFNVRLAGELLGNGLDVGMLTPIETQIGLLDLYWRERVIRTDHQGNAREAILARAVEKMVASRSLRANRREIATDAALSRALDDVLSAHILSEWTPTADAPPDRSVLTFAHHVLFDYAVARLLLRGTTESLIELLGRETDIVIAIRPSVVMHFQYEWQRDREIFWDAVFRTINSEQIPEIGKLIGPTVAVESAKSADDFVPFTRALFSAEPPTRETADKCMRHITGALLVHAIKSPTGLAGEGQLVWAELLEASTAEMRTNIAYSARPILLSICGHPDRMTNQQRRCAGIVARRLLHFALDQEAHDSMLISGGIEAVCRTFESDPEASGVGLRRCLDSDHVAKYGYEELFRLGHEVDRLIPLEPELVEEIFTATFTNYDDREQPTPLLGSGILRLTTTPRQEFDMARWLLSTKYKEFLQGAPLHATRTLLTALKTYVADHYESRFGDRPEETFDFNGKPAYVATDYSEIWDEGTAHADDQSVRMLQAFQNYVEELWGNEGQIALQSRLLDLLISENRSAAIWRRLLISATKKPKLALDLRPLSWALPILMNYDTSRAVGDYLSVMFASLSSGERQRVEEAILSVPNKANDTYWSDPEYTRNRLLGCLDANFLVTEEARRIRQEKPAPPNEPVFKTSIVTGVYSDEDYLRDQGVPLDAEQNRRLLQLAESAKVFGEMYRNSAPPLEQAEQVLPDLQRLHDALRSAESNKIPESERTLAWGYLAEGARALAEVADLSRDSNVGLLARQLLLEAGVHPAPPAQPEYDAQFDRHPSWGSPAPRIDAAHGLIRLARQEAFADHEILEAIERLVRDEVPAVRYQVAINLSALYHTANDLMWKLLESRSRDDASRGVLQGMLVGALHRLAAHDPERVTNCVISIFDRIRDGDGASEVRRRCTSIFTGLDLWRHEGRCAEIVRRIVEDPSHYDSEAGQIIFDVRNWLNLGPVEPSNSEQDAIRVGSFGLFEQILRSILSRWRPLEEKFRNAGSTPLSAQDQEEARILGRLAESVCIHVYFVSGAYKDVPGDQSEKIPMGFAERKRFLDDARTVLELLSDFSLPSLTHHLLEMLEFFIPYEPRRVFLLVGRVVRTGKGGGYQYESMAVDLVVRLVERFIAEFRHILREDEECRRTLVEILDIFVDAGWASARKLTYRMEEIFR